MPMATGLASASRRTSKSSNPNAMLVMFEPWREQGCLRGDMSTNRRLLTFGLRQGITPMNVFFGIHYLLVNAKSPVGFGLLFGM
jgi:hypothetical protein